MQTLLDRPALPPHLRCVIQAATDLAGDQGMAGGIPFAAFATWCSVTGTSDVFWLWDRLQALQEAQRDLSS